MIHLPKHLTSVVISQKSEFHLMKKNENRGQAFNLRQDLTTSWNA